MRLGHEADAAPRRLQDRGKASCSRSLAIGAGDEGAPETALGIAETIEDRARPLGAELHSETAKPRDVGEGLVVSHGVIVVRSRRRGFRTARRGPSPPPARLSLPQSPAHLT